MKILTLDGAAIHDIPSLYDEINRVLMAGEDWTLGPSLDALDDLLYGGFGAIDGDEPVTLVWEDFDRMQDVLGLATTRAFLNQKLDRPEVFNANLICRQLEALERGIGQTYLEIVLEIITSHANIELVRR
ncbi:barstar family protein [Brevundimonas sp. NIBR11]|uniref:barstar family protein n=1 Tax=Brevundimonas sp. NIBR11 TaxID=3015999 RepID=UPI0022F07E86|nr:barstar family protein [Brevundimonas sp. NIBR11]WGM32819.1 hypothetical protein KKHFBJBL_03074 [Brevundimonas sp. NIBR11]